LASDALSVGDQINIVVFAAAKANAENGMENNAFSVILNSDDREGEFEL
jgi:hypothetical protein